MSAALQAQQLLSVAGSHPGYRRPHNEDAVLARPEAGLWAVADGMGGHSHGGLASRQLAEALSTLAARWRGARLLAGIPPALAAANRSLLARAREQGGGCIIGSTVVVLALAADRFHCLWAGDSRAYLWRRGILHRLTEDHRTPGDGGRLTRAVGAEAELVLDARAGSLYRGDLFLLCSDGLCGLLDERRIAEVLARERPPNYVSALIRATLERGAPDNVSCVVVGVPGG
ncbi:PP2C family protein-serine/threonine phosphatase [Alkalilimnicola sp. S0819]|uniref:PP2C family protein-serine/threonine phosphatase n=1 Tax=Alkalilimnicola sp. S0819 TaxID=2613922 RepID=UPI00186A9D4A|nr:PP2C family serine/threonine-protein phosphatase [Alkalilimnicola sp. S0819]